MHLKDRVSYLIKVSSFWV